MQKYKDGIKHTTGTFGQFGRRYFLVFGISLALGCTAAIAQTELTDLAKIQARGALRVAVYKDNAPFSQGAANDLSGLDVSIAQALAKQLQLKLELLPFDAGENMNDDLRNMVWKGHYLGYGPADVMMNVPVDKYLAQSNPQVSIFAPYMRQVLVVLHDKRTLATVSGPEDLKGLELAAERGSGNASVLMGNNSGMLRDQVHLYNSGVDAARAVVDGKAAAAYVMRSQAEAVLAQVKTSTDDFALTPMSLSGMPANGWALGIAVKASNKDLGEALSLAMNTLQASGDMLAIFKQYGLTLTAP